MNIAGQVIVVTGAARGLGAAMAEALIAKGAIVALVDLDLDVVKNTCDKIDSGGENSGAFAADVSQEFAVVNLFSNIETQLGPISGVVNNAGILRDGLLVKVKDGEITGKMSLEQWQSVIDVNLTGVFLCGREAASCMIKSKTKGVIVNISSISKTGNRGQSNYAAAKAGVAALTVTWAQELSRFGIRVSGIAPGIFGTEMINQLPEHARDGLEKLIPLGRIGELQELAHTLCYLVENEYSTGRIIELDGGLRM